MLGKSNISIIPNWVASKLRIQVTLKITFFQQTLNSISSDKASFHLHLQSLLSRWNIPIIDVELRDKPNYGSNDPANSSNVSFFDSLRVPSRME